MFDTLHVFFIFFVVGFVSESHPELFHIEWTHPFNYNGCIVPSRNCHVAHVCIDHQSKIWFVFFTWILQCAFENRDDFIVLTEHFVKVDTNFIYSSWDNAHAPIVGCITGSRCKVGQTQGPVRWCIQPHCVMDDTPLAMRSFAFYP